MHFANMPSSRITHNEYVIGGFDNSRGKFVYSSHLVNFAANMLNDTIRAAYLLSLRIL